MPRSRFREVLQTPPCTSFTQLLFMRCARVPKVGANSQLGLYDATGCKVTCARSREVGGVGTVLEIRLQPAGGLIVSLFKVSPKYSGSVQYTYPSALSRRTSYLAPPSSNRAKCHQFPDSRSQTAAVSKGGAFSIPLSQL